MKTKLTALLLFCWFGSICLIAEETSMMTVAGKVSVCEFLEADNGGFPYCLVVEVQSPGELKGVSMPYLYFKSLDDLKVRNGSINTADIVSFEAPKRFFAPRKVSDPRRHLAELKNLTLVTKGPSGNDKGPSPTQTPQTSATKAPAHPEPLPAPTSWPNELKQNSATAKSDVLGNNH